VPVDRTTAATQSEASEVINFWVMGSIFTDVPDNGLITAPRGRSRMVEASGTSTV